LRGWASECLASGIDAYDRQYDGAISSEIMLLSSIITTNSSMTTKQTADSTF